MVAHLKLHSIQWWQWGRVRALILADDATYLSDRDELSEWLGDPRNEGKVVQTRLGASERVIARVTDGIYRQPSSALRELISNAWDADAKNVTVLTDAPRFSRIYVRDDGVGMSHATLARLLKSIGGSAKRTDDGSELGITSANDPETSPAGRPLIGKIGIGLFSVSQLARSFQIITKSKGEDYRLIAEIRLRAFSEDSNEADARENDDKYISGDVSIRREHTGDLSAHGTDIILDDIKPRVRDILRGGDRWRAIDAKDAALEANDLETWMNMTVHEPKFHAGWMAESLKDTDGPSILTREAYLPWGAEDPAEARMAKLVDAVEGEFTRLDRPDLANTLDSYLEMIWTLGLSAPVKYVDTHPFDLIQDGTYRLFWLSNASKGRAEELDFQFGSTVRASVQSLAPGNPSLTDGIDPVGDFNVNIDGLELRRPIRFKFYKTEKRGLDKAMMFVGRYEPDMSKIDSKDRGGDLSFESYLFWTGRVIPKENNGVLARIRGASGALFDSKFFNYQVAELNRLKQIISEIFVHRGMDAALNIDRESFNFAHPHIQIATLWLHNAIRQITNRLKDESKHLRLGRKVEDSNLTADKLTSVSTDLWHRRRGDEDVPDIVIASSDEAARVARSEGSFALSREALPTLHHLAGPERTIRESQVAAVSRVLSAFGVFEGRPYEEQAALVDAIILIFNQAVE